MAAMKLIPSKALAKALTTSKANKHGYTVTQTKIYDFFEGEINALRVSYPWQYYAMPQDYTQQEINRLVKILQKTNGKTLDDFAEIFFDDAEV